MNNLRWLIHFNRIYPLWSVRDWIRQRVRRVRRWWERLEDEE